MRGPSGRARRLVKLFHGIFPERQIILRSDGRLRHLRLGRGSQAAMAAALSAGLGWFAYASFGVVAHHELLAVKDREIRETQHAYRSLLAEISLYQTKFSDIIRDLEENHSVMLGLLEQNASLQQSLASVETQLQDVERDRAQMAAVRERLKSDLREVERKMIALTTRNFSLKDNLHATESDLNAALAERNAALREQRQLETQVAGLRSALETLRVNEQEAVRRLTEHARDNLADAERLIGMAGLSVDDLLAAANHPIAQGGPFVAAGDGDPTADPAGRTMRDRLASLDHYMDRWEGMRDVLARLPLTVPVTNGYLTSSFGKRRDPINRKWAMHYGLDFGGPKKSPIYVTAPGVVKFAGRKGRYGKVVIIDHGAGLETVYAHLHTSLVRRGEKVDHRQKIGLMGSSGRSTGTHLHYEVRFRGKPMNPMNFIKAGRNVFQG